MNLKVTDPDSNEIIPLFTVAPRSLNCIIQKLSLVENPCILYVRCVLY